MGRKGSPQEPKEGCLTGTSVPASAPGSVQSLRVSTPPAPGDIAAFRGSFSSTSGSDASQQPEREQCHRRHSACHRHDSCRGEPHASSYATCSGSSRSSNRSRSPWSKSRTQRLRATFNEPHSELKLSHQEQDLRPCYSMSDASAQRSQQGGWSGVGGSSGAAAHGLSGCTARPSSVCVARPSSAASCIQCPDSEAKLAAARDAVVDLLSRLTEATEERDEAVERAHREWHLAELLRRRLASSPGCRDALLAAEGGRLPIKMRSSRIGHLQSPQLSPLKPPLPQQQKALGVRVQAPPLQRSTSEQPSAGVAAHALGRLHAHQMLHAHHLRQPSSEVELVDCECYSSSDDSSSCPTQRVLTFSGGGCDSSDAASAPWAHRNRKQPSVRCLSSGAMRHSRRSLQFSSERSSGSPQGLVPLREVPPDEHQQNTSPFRRSASARMPLVPHLRSKQHRTVEVQQERVLLAEAQERAAVLEERLHQSHAAIMQLLPSSPASVAALAPAASLPTPLPSSRTVDRPGGLSGHQAAPPGEGAELLHRLQWLAAEAMHATSPAQTDDDHGSQPEQVRKHQLEVQLQMKAAMADLSESRAACGCEPQPAPSGAAKPNLGQQALSSTPSHNFIALRDAVNFALKGGPGACSNGKIHHERASSSASAVSAATSAAQQSRAALEAARADMVAAVGMLAQWRENTSHTAFSSPLGPRASSAVSTASPAARSLWGHAQ
mmetsp:Transcript_4833/g.13899  ORF Transcript_4833/g.13899 Transcript_4833/m.13899 type:complete len:722 (+) Transcript_4833:254-2419(+)